MASSAYARRSVTQATAKGAKLYLEAYQFILSASGIKSVSKIGDVVSTSARGVHTNSASLILSWEKPDDKKNHIEADTLTIEIPSGVITDLDNSSLHRMLRKDLQTALELSLQEILKVADEPTPIYKEAELCLKRFYPNRQEPVECLTIVGQNAFKARKVYIRTTFESKDVIDELFTKGKQFKGAMKGVSISLSVTTKDVKISSPIFKALKVYGTNKTPEEQEIIYKKLCLNPKVSPTDIYNSMLATAYLHKPDAPMAADAIRVVLAMARF
jgi:hypothetical protein